MAKEFEQTDELRKGDVLPDDSQALIDSIVRLLRQADRQKLSSVYHFVINLI